jgi:hypothetical protein
MTSIVSHWSWPVHPPSVPVILSGETKTAAAHLRVLEARLSQASQLLCAGLVLTADTEVTWIKDGDRYTLMIDSADVQMMQTFGYDDSDRLYVEFKLLALETTLQNKALTRTALRNAAIVYDDLGVDYCIAYANFDIGGYAWAKLGAMPADPEDCRADLSKKTHRDDDDLHVPRARPPCASHRRHRAGNPDVRSGQRQSGRKGCLGKAAADGI